MSCLHVITLSGTWVLWSRVHEQFWTCLYLSGVYCDYVLCLCPWVSLDCVCGVLVFLGHQAWWVCEAGHTRGEGSHTPAADQDSRGSYIAVWLSAHRRWMVAWLPISVCSLSVNVSLSRFRCELTVASLAFPAGVQEWEGSEQKYCRSRDTEHGHWEEDIERESHWESLLCNYLPHCK